jgi:CheY-like chemotaxis protein
LRQILLNLVGNAIKFTENGRVELSVHLDRSRSWQPQLVFDVVDTGIGLTDGQVERLFQPFTQADTSTTRRFGGTGLGLTISKRLAEMLGGDITVLHTSPQGSAFRLTVATGPLAGVPMLDSPAPDRMPEHGPAETPAALPERLAGRLLLVEDGPDNQRLFARILRKAGALVTIVDNGQRAVRLVQAAEAAGRPFDLVLMDMQMPVMDGYEATRVLRAAGYHRPIIALTAHAMARDRETCLRAGCDDYISKPVDRRVLLAALARHLPSG